MPDEHDLFALGIDKHGLPWGLDESVVNLVTKQWRPPTLRRALGCPLGRNSAPKTFPSGGDFLMAARDMAVNEEGQP